MSLLLIPLDIRAASAGPLFANHVGSHFANQCAQLFNFSFALRFGALGAAKALPYREQLGVHNA